MKQAIAVYFGRKNILLNTLASLMTSGHRRDYRFLQQLTLKDEQSNPCQVNAGNEWGVLDCLLKLM